MGWNNLFIPQIQWLDRWIFEMDMQFYPARNL